MMELLGSRTVEQRQLKPAPAIPSSVLLASRAGLGAGSGSALTLLIGAGALTFAVAAWLAGAVDPRLVRGLRPASRP